MKKIFPIILLMFSVFMFSSCKASEPAVAGSDAVASEITTTEETADTTERTENSSDNNIETTNAENIPNKNGASEAESSDFTETENNRVSQENHSEDVIVRDNEIIAPAYKLEIPEDFELKSDGENPLLENKEGTVQFNIMDKTESATDFEKYVTDTYNSARAVGMADGEIEDVTVAGVPMKRFSMIMKDDDGAELAAYAYLAQVNGRVLLITLTSKDGGLSDVSAADAFVESIEF